MLQELETEAAAAAAEEASSAAGRKHAEVQAKHEAATKQAAKCKRQVSDAARAGGQADAALHKAQAAVKVQQQQLRTKEKQAKQGKAALSKLQSRHGALASAASDLADEEARQQMQRCLLHIHLSIILLSLQCSRAPDLRCKSSFNHNASEASAGTMRTMRCSRRCSPTSPHLLAMSLLWSRPSTPSPLLKPPWQPRGSGSRVQAKRLNQLPPRSSQHKTSVGCCNSPSTQPQLSCPPLRQTSSARSLCKHSYSSNLRQRLRSMRPQSGRWNWQKQQVQDEARGAQEGNALERAIAHIIAEGEKGAALATLAIGYLTTCSNAHARLGMQHQVQLYFRHASPSTHRFVTQRRAFQRHGTQPHGIQRLGNLRLTTHQERTLKPIVGQLDIACDLAGRLPGEVFGRICDCAQATDASLVGVLNTALGCTANLATTLIVSNRAAALSALEHLRATRAGCARCLIVEESSGRFAAGAARNLSPALVSAGARGLAKCLRAQHGREPALQGVQDLLSSWVAVPDWAAAESCSAAQKGSRDRVGIVTQYASLGWESCAAANFQDARTSDCTNMQGQAVRSVAQVH